MAKVFLDTNIYIDVIKRRTDAQLEDFQDQDIFISPLSVHILTYTYKYKVPNNELDVNPEFFNIVNLDNDVVKNALLGPTDDFEDNVQLHSAAKAQCDLFLTKDKKLLNLKFFGKTKIIQDLTN